MLELAQLPQPTPAQRSPARPFYLLFLCLASLIPRGLHPAARAPTLQHWKDDGQLFQLKHLPFFFFPLSFPLNRSSPADAASKGGVWRAEMGESWKPAEPVWSLKDSWLPP